MTNLPDIIESDDGNRWVPTVELRWKEVVVKSKKWPPRHPVEYRFLEQRFYCLSGPRLGEREWRDIPVVSEGET
jgi:hypothetical protein